MIKELTSFTNLSILNFSDNSFLKKKNPSEINLFLMIFLNLIDQSLYDLLLKKEISDFQFCSWFIDNFQLNNDYFLENNQIIQNMDDNFENIDGKLYMENIIDIFLKMNQRFENFERISNLIFFDLDKQKANFYNNRNEKAFSFNLNYETNSEIDNNLNEEIKNEEMSINQKSNIVFLKPDKIQNFKEYFLCSKIDEVDLNFDKDLNEIQRLQYTISQFLIKKNHLIQNHVDNSELNNKDFKKNIFQQNSDWAVSLKTVVKTDKDLKEFNKAKVSDIKDEILVQRITEKGNNIYTSQILESEELEFGEKNKGFDLVFQTNKNLLVKFGNFQRFMNEDLINFHLNLHNTSAIQSQINLEKISINFQNFTEEIVEFLKNILLEFQPEQVNRALIKLEPPEMGVLELEIKVKNKEVEIIAKIEKPEVFQEIRQNLNNMKAILENSGMILKDFQMFLTTNFYNGKMSAYDFGKENRKNNESKDRIGDIKNAFENTMWQNNQVEKFYNKNGKYYYVV